MTRPIHTRVVKKTPVRRPKPELRVPRLRADREAVVHVRLVNRVSDTRLMVIDLEKNPQA